MLECIDLEYFWGLPLLALLRAAQSIPAAYRARVAVIVVGIAACLPNTSPMTTAVPDVAVLEDTGEITPG